MPEPDPLLGHELGDYRPTAPLGRGGMGVVYLADDLALDRKVALKVLAPEYVEDRQARERFQREIDAAVGVEHPNIVPVYAAGYAPPHFYIAMRLVPGADLHDVLVKEGPIVEDRALRLVGQVASALAAVHAGGIVHRDVKPHNVLVWSAGSDDEHALLTDFGIAKAAVETQGLTGVGAIGTPAYMAPEVCAGQAAVAASDQYSLACMTYELLSGATPFAGDAPAQREAHLDAPVPRLSESIASPLVADAVERGMAKEPSDRFEDVRSFAQATGAGREAFQRAEAITHVMATEREIATKVMRLGDEQELSSAAISQLIELPELEVLKLRRRRAREALLGGPARRTPTDSTRP